MLKKTTGSFFSAILCLLVYCVSFEKSFAQDTTVTAVNPIPYAVQNIAVVDLDGVLIDSVPNMRTALRMTSLSLNIKLDFVLYRKYLGLPFENIMKKMGVKKNINKIKAEYSFFSKKTLSKIKIKTKHLDELNCLKKNFNFAVFTSKDKSRTKIILKEYKFFKNIITSDDVTKGKPYPEGLIKILKRSNLYW